MILSLSGVVCKCCRTRYLEYCGSKFVHGSLFVRTLYQLYAHPHATLPEFGPGFHRFMPNLRTPLTPDPKFHPSLPMASSPLTPTTFPVPGLVCASPLSPQSPSWPERNQLDAALWCPRL